MVWLLARAAAAHWGFSLLTKGNCGITPDMNIKVSKEVIATLASTVAIIAFLASIAMQMGEMRGAIEANSEAISELREDVRELRGILTSHLTAHAAYAAQSVAGRQAQGE